MQKIAILYDASQAVLSTFDLDEVLQHILVIARDYFHLQNVAILLLDKDSTSSAPDRRSEARRASKTFAYHRNGADRHRGQKKAPLMGRISLRIRAISPREKEDPFRAGNSAHGARRSCRRAGLPERKSRPFRPRNGRSVTLFSTQARWRCKTHGCIRWNAVALRNWKRSMPSRGKPRSSWTLKNLLVESLRKDQEGFRSLPRFDALKDEDELVCVRTTAT